MTLTYRFAYLAVAGSLFMGLPGCKTSTMAPPPGLIDAASIDSTVRPQDDFFQYANGSWIKRTDIPGSQSAWGAIITLGDQSVEKMHHILDSLSNTPGLQKGTIAQQVGDLYGSLMDSTKIESLGIGPLQTDLASIQAIKDGPGLLKEATRLQGDEIDVLFNFYVSADDKNSMMNVAHFGQGGLSLPNKEYYFKLDTSIVKIRNAFQTYVTTVLTLTGMPAAAASKAAAGVLTVETQLARGSRSPVELRDPEANYHKIAVADLGKSTGGFAWPALLSGLGVKQDTVLVGQPEFYAHLDTTISTLSLTDIKNYLTFRVVNSYIGALGHEFQDAQFAYSKMLSGQKEPRPRWKRASSTVDRLLGDALGQLYVQRYFPPEAKQRMKDLVDNMQATYAEHIQGLDWMSDSTKTKALVKLHAITKKIGYPDKWKDYSSISISRDDALGNIRHCNQYEYQRDLKKIGQPVDRSEWDMTPPTVDAYYNPTANDINFPAGILQPPFFFQDGDDAMNYGAIGLVIGHEMTHGFDDQGRLYDADGNLKSWWSSADSAKFVKKANLIVQQYDNYVAIDTFHINGRFTLGENIADVGGLAIAYSAFKKTNEGKDTTRFEGLTPDQRFFRAYAQVWKVKFRPEALRTQVLSNEHSTPQFRVNGPVSNLDGFYDAFDVKPGDKMYLPDSLRAHIW